MGIWLFSRGFRPNSFSPKMETVVQLRRRMNSLALETNSPYVYMIKGMDEDAMNKDLQAYCRNAKVLEHRICAFLSPAALGYELPDAEQAIPEFAFVGRSNVGKSTLLGCLINNPSLVKTSKTPGCTRSINYFGIFDRIPVEAKGSVAMKPKFYLVDLPGYGFAKARPKAVTQWQRTMEDFLVDRPPDILRRVYLLVDARRGLKDLDERMMCILDEAGVPYQMILTKIDLATPTKLRGVVQSVFDSMITERHGACMPVVHLVSSKLGAGIIEMKGSICTTAQETVKI